MSMPQSPFGSPFEQPADITPGMIQDGLDAVAADMRPVLMDVEDFIAGPLRDAGQAVAELTRDVNVHLANGMRPAMDIYNSVAESLGHYITTQLGQVYEYAAIVGVPLPDDSQLPPAPPLAQYFPGLDAPLPSPVLTRRPRRGTSNAPSPSAAGQVDTALSAQLSTSGLPGQSVSTTNPADSPQTPQGAPAGLFSSSLPASPLVQIGSQIGSYWAQQCGDGTAVIGSLAAGEQPADGPNTFYFATENELAAWLGVNAQAGIVASCGGRTILPPLPDPIPPPPPPPCPPCPQPEQHYDVYQRKDRSCYVVTLPDRPETVGDSWRGRYLDQGNADIAARNCERPADGCPPAGSDKCPPGADLRWAADDCSEKAIAGLYKIIGVDLQQFMRGETYLDTLTKIFEPHGVDIFGVANDDRPNRVREY